MQDDPSGDLGAHSRLTRRLIVLGLLDVALVTAALGWRHHHHQSPAVLAATASIRPAVAASPALTRNRVPAFRDPCLVLRISLASDAAPPAGLPIQECPTLQQLPADPTVETVSIHLRQGLLEDAHSELPLPGSPLRSFKRALLSGYTNFPFALGVAASNNADTFLATSDDMRHLELESSGDSEVLVRRPFYIPALLFNEWVSDPNDHGEATIKWRASPERFDLQRADGTLESYLPCEGQQFCLLTAIRDARGGVTHISRDAQRHLVGIDAPGGATLHFTYGPAGIAQLADAQGHAIQYTYDPRGYLAGVLYPDGSRIHFAWTTRGELASLSTASGAAETLRERMHADYKNSRVTSLTFPDGSVYLLGSLQRDDAGRGPQAVVLSAPDGTLMKIAFGEYGAILLPGQRTRSPAR